MAGGALTVLHTSDYQCGAPFLPEAADAMIRLAEAIDPDLVVAAGDLTQRAKSREFLQARALLERFGEVPTVVTPGNHDVPLYRFWERSAAPYRNWRRFAGPDLDTVTRIEGGTFVALNSSAPRRALVNGRIRERQLDFARGAFARAPARDLRVLVTHHHFVPAPRGEGGRPLPRARHLVRAFEEMGVDVVLGGHVHQLHITSSLDFTTRAGAAPTTTATTPLPLIACGTTTSRRGRGVEAGANSLCVLRRLDQELVVTPYLRRVGDRDFRPLEERRFGLRGGVGPASGISGGGASR